MKRFFVVANKLGIKEILLICLFVGVGLGTLTANLLKELYIDQFFLFDDSYLSRIQNTDMDCFMIFQMAFIDYIKEFGLIILLCTTIIGSPYILFHCTYKGFCLGFIISTAIMRYGVSGLLFLLAYISPQCLTYVPILIFTYLKGYEYNCTVYSAKDKTISTYNPYKRYIPYLAFLLVVIGITSLLEGYINTSLIRIVMLKLVS